MAVISPSVPIMSLFGIYRSSSIVLAAASHSLQRERAPSRAVRSVPDSFTSSLISLQAQQRFSLPVCERAPFARALGLAAGQAQDLESPGEALVPKPAVHATRLGISAGQLLALC